MMDSDQKIGDCSTCGWKDRLDKVGWCYGCIHSTDSAGKTIRSGWTPKMNMTVSSTVSWPIPVNEERPLSIRRWIVTYVEYGDSVDGKARILGVYMDPEAAYNAMRDDANRYKNELCLDHIEVFDDSASVGETDECGCEYRIDMFDIELADTDWDVFAFAEKGKDSR